MDNTFDITDLGKKWGVVLGQALAEIVLLEKKVLHSQEVIDDLQGKLHKAQCDLVEKDKS